MLINVILNLAYVHIFYVKKQLKILLLAGLTQILDVAIQREITGRRIDPWAMHREMRNLYTWPDVARRTEIVYDKVRGEESSADIYQRIPR